MLCCVEVKAKHMQKFRDAPIFCFCILLPLVIRLFLSLF